MVKRVTVNRARQALNEAELTGFTKGIAHVIGHMIKDGRRDAGLQVMESLGYEYRDFLEAGSYHRDIAPIADALRLTVAGKPRKKP